MGYVTIIIIALTAIALVFGALWGMKRGLKHSILRLILIIGCAVGAIFLHQPLANVINGIEFGDAKLVEMFVGKVDSEEELMLNVAIVQGIVKIVSYLVVFGLLRLLSWLIVFPILKIFIKKDLIKHRWWGALVGLLQGVVVAFVVLVPLNGLASDLTTISKALGNENVATGIVKDLDLEKYTESSISGIYKSIGDWYYKIVIEQK